MTAVQFIINGDLATNIHPCVRCDPAVVAIPPTGAMGESGEDLIVPGHVISEGPLQILFHQGVFSCAELHLKEEA